MTILLTSRLRLAPYCLADIDSLHSIMKDERVMQHIGKGAMSRDEVVQLVNRVEKRWRDINMGWWTIRSKSNDRVLGQICLQPITELPEIGVGYALEPSSWGLGFAEEAMAEVLRYASEEKQLSSVVALVRPENLHSISLLARSKFVFESALPLRNKTLYLYRRVFDQREGLTPSSLR
jgi:ribosomal-protein-alanine N-acetyltransferase